MHVQVVHFLAAFGTTVDHGAEGVEACRPRVLRLAVKEPLKLCLCLAQVRKVHHLAPGLRGTDGTLADILRSQRRGRLVHLLCEKSGMLTL